MQVEYIGAFNIVLGVIARFWPVWLGLALVMGASFTYKKRLGLYGQLFDSGVGIVGVGILNGAIFVIARLFLWLHMTVLLIACACGQ